MKNNNGKQKAKIASVVAGAMLLATTVIPFSVSAAELDSADSQATVGFTAGLLELVEVPNFDFGMNTIPAQITEYQAETGYSKVIISDARGTNAGWDVKVSLAPFSEGGSESLNGSTIFLNGGTVSPMEGTQGTPPYMPSGITLSSDNTAVNIMQASLDSGGGTFAGEWNNESISLMVLPNPSVRVGNHTSQITWALHDAP